MKKICNTTNVLKLQLFLDIRNSKTYHAIIDYFVSMGNLTEIDFFKATRQNIKINELIQLIEKNPVKKLGLSIAPLIFKNYFIN